MEDHIHIVTDLHPTVALSNLVKDIKLGSGDWIRRENVFPFFRGWQEGYGAFTYSIDRRETLVRYVQNQAIHHAIRNYEEEYMALLKEHGVDFNEKYQL